MPKHTTPSLEYIRKLYAPQDALLDEIDASLERINMMMHVGAEEGKLLQMLIRLSGAKKIVEIGTLAGYSTLWMARALQDDGHIYTINKDLGHIALARDFFARSEVTHKITMLEGKAQAMLPTLTHQAPFDMVFIDADKISYNDYLDWALLHVRVGGLIVADNTLQGGKLAGDDIAEGMAPTTWHNMQRFNARLADTSRFFTAVIPTLEGLTVAVKL